MTKIELLATAKEMGLEANKDMEAKEIKAMIVAHEEATAEEVETVETTDVVGSDEESRTKARKEMAKGKKFAINFKKGDLVVSSSGSYSRIIDIKGHLFIGTKWCMSIRLAMQEGNKAGTRFNEYAARVMNIVKAKTPNKKDEE